MEAVKLDSYPLDVAPLLAGSDDFSAIRASPEPSDLPPESSCSFLGKEIAEHPKWKRFTDSDFFCVDKNLPNGDAKFVTPKTEFVDFCGKGKRGRAPSSKRLSISHTEDAGFLYEGEEKTHLGKKRACLINKRSERRNSKLCIKAKYDSFTGKPNSVNSSVAVGGSNIFGLYGLKTDVSDITLQIDDISLNDLLEGSYTRPSLAKHKEKKPESTPVDIFLTLRRALDVIPTKSETTSDFEVSDKLLDFPFAPPSETLKRVALPPAMGLESLLNAGKPHSPESRSGKHMLRRPSLPPFQWSHGSVSKTNADAVKLLTSRNQCQGKWVTANYVNSQYLTLEKLESLTYNESLVPKFNRKRPLGTRGSEKTVEQCPNILAAARTLCEIGTRKEGKMGLLKKIGKGEKKNGGRKGKTCVEDKVVRRANGSLEHSKVLGRQCSGPRKVRKLMNVE